ncbi:eukaryotic translation initiation factor 2 subunit gamma, partial [Cryomyces antarcticus]
MPESDEESVLGSPGLDAQQDSDIDDMAQQGHQMPKSALKKSSQFVPTAVASRPTLPEQPDPKNL